MKVEKVFDSFIINALIGGICVSIIAGGLGCFVVWKKMAYFGDSLSHSSLLGIAIGIVLGFNSTIGTFLVCIVFATLLTYLQNKKILSNDTLLGILAHASLSEPVGQPSSPPLTSAVADALPWGRVDPSG